MYLTKFLILEKLYFAINFMKLPALGYFGDFGVTHLDTEVILTHLTEFLILENPLINPLFL